MTKIRNVRKATKYKRSIRAISPVIATLLMIAIAVVASLVVYAWVMGYMGGATTKAGNAIQIQSAAPNSDDKWVVYVQNVGQGAVSLKPGQSVYFNGNLVSFAGTDDITIAEGQTAELVTTATYTEGEKVEIKVTTTGGTFTLITKTGTSTTGDGGPPGNAVPMIITSSPGDPASVTQGGSLDFSVTATDADVGDTLTYKWYLDGSVRSDIDNTYTYPSASGTSHIVRVEVSDGKVTTPTSQSWTVTVTTPIPKLAITEDVVSTNINERSSSIEVHRQDATGNDVNPSYATTVRLASTSTTGVFYYYTGGGGGSYVPTTSVTINSGSTHAHFYYLDTTAGTPILTATDTSSTPVYAADTRTLLVIGQFGNTDGSGSSMESIENTVRGSVFTTSQSIVVHSIVARIYVSDNDNFNMKAAIYDASNTQIATTPQIIVGDGSNWITFDFSSAVNLNVGAYKLVVYSASSSDTANLYYSTTSASGSGISQSETYGTWPTPVNFTPNTRVYSIYCTYY